MKLVLMIDNGGYSMTPYVDITRLLFSKMHDRFEDITTYYFHNCIYERVYVDQRRIRSFPVEKLLQKNPDTRVVILGDATMAPRSSFRLLARSPASTCMTRAPECIGSNASPSASSTPSG
jgi:uncharacterized protein